MLAGPHIRCRNGDDFDRNNPGCRHKSEKFRWNISIILRYSLKVTAFGPEGPKAVTNRLLLH